jgi:hypothetical protein
MYSFIKQWTKSNWSAMAVTPPPPPPTTTTTTKNNKQQQQHTTLIKLQKYIMNMMVSLDDVTSCNLVRIN